MQILNTCLNYKKTLFTKNILIISIFSTYLCSISEKYFSDLETQQIESDYVVISEVTDIPNGINTNIIKNNDSEYEFITISNYVNNSLLEKKIDENKHNGKFLNREKNCVRVHRESVKILETIFYIFESLDEFQTHKKNLIAINEVFGEKVKNLCVSQTEGEKKYAFKEFYRIYFEGYEINFNLCHSNFINIFIQLINLFTMNYPKPEQVNDKLSTNLFDLDVLFVTEGHITSTCDHVYNLLRGYSIYDQNIIPIFTPEGLFFYKQEWTFKDNKYERLKFSQCEICIIDRFSDYLMFDAKQNLNFFFEYFRNNFTYVKFEHYYYELIGFVLDNTECECFMVKEGSVISNINDVKINWLDFKKKYGDKYGEENVVLILKKQF